MHVNIHLYLLQTFDQQNQRWLFLSYSLLAKVYHVLFDDGGNHVQAEAATHCMVHVWRKRCVSVAASGF